MKINRSIIALAISSLLIISCKENKEKDNMNEDSMEMNDSSDMSEGNEMSSDDEMQDDVEIEEDITENGNEMNLSQVAMNAKDLSTFVAALQKAGMVVKIEGEGPYTIFAPTNEAFNKLPKGTVESLMEPSNTEKLEEIISYHIIPGNVDSTKLKSLIEESENKKYTLETANNGKIDAMLIDGEIVLKDGKGTEIMITNADQKGQNGVIHSVNTVLMRK
ncbi:MULTISPECIES: fasciclin domain-containing protein [Mesonia]|uniref:Immunogenic protein MPB70 n=1 Tax=Mesonia oceanica TaxID=2687242 RepID=A0AC61Y7I1_9FLAO|nr:MULTISPECIES: fasciclin domain-containing protein [Mesonia]MAN26286.1 hypothetical protein [Mesonia sp.]MAQ42156.1 hypothetical protein [Mesonia sp.]MBJ97974.1 hypothetical protein [Flavobacteriaceae bacterium]VVV00145.1 Immunogenic protein MPB70 [Mesonia oceanica]|tara:strand:- start:7552 stop:8208 length:657 start_codon:yes stop_codon:yes gene_type:complete